MGRNGAGRPVFIAEHFYYFGKRRVGIPSEFGTVIQRQQGIHYTRGQQARDFIAWLEANYAPGRLGTPRDMPARAAGTGTTAAGSAAVKGKERGDCRPEPRPVAAIQPRKGCR